MTLPDEEGNSIILARLFLRSLLDPKMTPRVPTKIRKAAGHRLKHYPGEYQIKEYIKLKYGETVSEALHDPDEVWGSWYKEAHGEPDPWLELKNGKPNEKEKGKKK